jgi:peptidyl-prolyl cis-trans isomerase SurA
MSITFVAQAQKTIEGVAAVVGGKIVLHSAIESQYMQMKAQGYEGEEKKLKCQIFEELLYQKLLANQAEVDSIEVSDVDINDAIEQRIRYFVSQIGSEQKLAEYFGKSISELKEEFKPVFREQMLAQRMEGRIASDVKATPEDVRKFYNAIPQDSLPMLPMEIQISQIVLYPKVEKTEKDRIEKKLLDFKKRVDGGEHIKFLATLYSEDEGSAKNGGELGFMGRGVLVPEFEAVAYRLQEGAISDVVKTKFGFHIIQMIARRGEQINVRHILIKPIVSATAMERAKTQLDSIVNLVSIDSLTFEEAAYKFSQDDSKNNGGKMINPQTGSSGFTPEELDPTLTFSVDKLVVNEISKATNFTSVDQRQGCRVLRLDKRTEPHRANLKDDYDRIQTVAQQDLKSKVSEKWVTEKITETYIDIKLDMRCDWNNKWKK